MSSFLGLVGLDRNTQAGPSQYPADFSYSSSNNNYNNNNNYNQEEGEDWQIPSYLSLELRVRVHS